MILRSQRSPGSLPPTWLLDRPLLKGLSVSSPPTDQQEDDANDNRDARGGGARRDWRGEFLQAIRSVLADMGKKGNSRNETSIIGEAADAAVEAALVDKLAGVTSIPADEIDSAHPLHVYGVDSLLAVELRNWFAKEFRADVAIFDITSGQMSLAEVARRAARVSELRAAAQVGA